MAKRSTCPPRGKLKIWAAYQIAALLPTRPVDAREVVDLAMEIVERVAARPAKAGRSAGLRRPRR